MGQVLLANDCLKQRYGIVSIKHKLIVTIIYFILQYAIYCILSGGIFYFEPPCRY